MNDDALRAARMRSQRLDGRARDPVELLRSIFCVQAQDTRAAALQIRARIEGLDAADVEHAVSVDRSIARVWAMRGTLHYVLAEDARWLIDLLAPLGLPAEHRRLTQLGVSEHVRPRAVRTIRAALERHGPQTRAELAEHLARAGLPADGPPSWHLVRLAAMEGHVCMGPDRGGKGTYALLSDWLVHGAKAKPRADALAELARRYVRAYAPADLRDFAYWSGLPAAEARAGWEAVAGEAAVAEADPPEPPLVRLLGGFDTYLLGYRSRDVAVPSEHSAEVWPGGGMIRRTVVANGLAVGTWRIERGEIELQPFGEPIEADEEVADVLRFLGAG